MKASAAKALRSSSGFDPRSQRGYAVTQRLKEVLTPEGPVKVARFQVTISADSKRRAYQAMKKVFKGLTQAQKSKLAAPLGA